jgi:hypothetical protein
MRDQLNSKTGYNLPRDIFSSSGNVPSGLHARSFANINQFFPSSSSSPS